MSEHSNAGAMRFHAYKGQGVSFRPPAPTTDRILEIPGLEVRQEELDLYTEFDPLKENIPPLRGPNKLVFPLVRRRREVLVEISPTVPPLIFMELLQRRVDRRLVGKHTGRRPTRKG